MPHVAYQAQLEAERTEKVEAKDALRQVNEVLLRESLRDTISAFASGGLC